MNLVKLRKENKKSQQDIAKLLNITQASYSRYENNQSEPDLNTLIKLADFYGVSLDYLCGHETKYMLDISSLNDYKKEVVDKLKQLNEVNDYILLGYISHMLDEQNKK